MKSKTKFNINEITLILIVAILAIVVSINKGVDVSPEIEIEKITAMILDEHELSFARNGIIDEDKLLEIQNMDYYELKRLLKAKNDFCIYIEDEDGNVILSKGSSRINGDGIYCVE